MKCVLLASGEGIRMRPLTLAHPKTLLTVHNKPIIKYIFESLPDEITEVIVVIKYLREQIRSFLGEEYMGKKITIAFGSEKGNAYSFLNIRKYLKDERFLLIYGDEMPTKDNVKRCLSKDLSVLMFESQKTKQLEIDGVMVLHTDIFNYKPLDENFKSLVDQFIKDHKVSFVTAKDFVGELNTPYDLKRAERIVHE